MTIMLAPPDAPAELDCDARGTPVALRWRAERYAVTDDPTPLEQALAGAVTHPPPVHGWRFQGTGPDGRAHVFDLVLHDRRWTVVRVWE